MAMNSLDFGRAIGSVRYDRETRLAVVEFQCSEDEIGDMIPGTSVCLCAWVNPSEEQAFHLRLTSNDCRIQRRDVQSKLVQAFNAAFKTRYLPEDVEVIEDLKCMERKF